MTSDPIARYLTQRTAKLDRRTRMRVMNGSEIIDVATRVYQVLGWTFLKATAVSTLFCLGSYVFLLSYVLPSYFVTSNPTSESQQLMEIVATTALALFVAAPLFLIGMSYSTAIVTQLVSDYMIGGVPSLEQARENAHKLVPKLLLLNLRTIFLASVGLLIPLALLMFAGHLGSATDQTDATAGVVLILATLGFCIGGIVSLVILQNYALAPAVMVVEGVSSKIAARRSRDLLKRFMFHPGGGSNIWQLYFVLAMLGLLVGGGISMSLGLIGYPDSFKALFAGMPYGSVLIQALGLIPSFLVIWILVPVWASSITIIYYERRIRMEGYDIEALAADVWRANKTSRFEL